jgi:hypothetical protein
MAVLEWVDTTPVETKAEPAAEKPKAAKKSAPKKDAE